MRLADWIEIAISALGFGFLAARLPIFVRRKGISPGKTYQAHSLVSIIVPARNEEANLPRLLASLSMIIYSALEVIVVDDESTDQTAAIVAAFADRDPRFRLVPGQARPDEWTGKNWACHQGFLQSRGEFLLFTDADTEHAPASLSFAIEKFVRRKTDLLSAIPFHRNEKFWEKILGPFHLMTLFSTAAFSHPRNRRLFAIGQYLLFSRDSYIKQGGHEKIRRMLCDDLELALECLSSGGNYFVEPEKLFEVRMFDSFAGFLKGWRRIFRLGFKRSDFFGAIEVYCLIALLTASMHFFAAPAAAVTLMFAGAIYLGWLQKRFGNFSLLGAILYPWSLAVFITVTILALYDSVFGTAYVWRGRSYSQTAD